ncbi:glutamate formimidoyltransferase-like [Lytechinus variegatus]|uniref:glutamate formimidoyltransferase-like n=1 Tax=Lytechinus variegatus TaxID=7654 RepID=UPI001BB12FDA|nr:glutamate formimidoyltransferase-like [Lytechinus variegatus]XP_041474290.1 glutamate formimidoyltransferase-like [Lytechinus variegatus]XP_041474291.1 glutamate formimidoyltransferase-like [Lytechinus variegatus]XP_041474292.1 glutamate formimidoyltransferase-like [Lytechinus variegatus]
MSSRGLGICLLNVSEARNRLIIENIALAATRSTSSSRILSSVLNIFQDIDYNRSVLTIAAPINNLKTAVCGACAEAYRQIDLSKQKGVHPRLGAVDLIPIYPLMSSVSLKECGEVAYSIAEDLSTEIPGSSFFLFGSADWPEQRGLVPRRKAIGWFKGKHGIDWSKFSHDLGAPPSSRYGLTGCGASHYVTNCNVTIDTQDLELGREIAHAIRGTTPGGLPGIQAMAFPHEGTIEIACNVDSLPREKQSTGESDGVDTDQNCPITLDYTSPETIEQRVKALAGEKGIGMVGTALIGFMPEEACRLAMDALQSGNDQLWKSRGVRLM